jgi:gliding motility-associated-like protein
MKRLANFAIFSLFYLSTKLHCQVVINEVMHYPVTAQGLIADGTEYVELFNNSNCESVDISCWKLGFANVDGFINNRGSIVLPVGTLIPPLGHFVIGTSNSSANPNAIDFKTNLNSSNLCVVGNFLLANGDGWIALYNNNGDVLDALFWTVNPNEFSKISSDSDLDDQPCIVNSVSNCNTGLALLSANQIYQNFPDKISYGGQGINGNTFSRIPDGGSWQRDIPPSINDLTVGNCNGGNCSTISSFNLNASITQPTCGNADGIIAFNPSPTGTYFYNWPFITTGNLSSASNLAEGSYQITITNLAGCTKDTIIVLSEDCPGCGLDASVSVQQNSVCEPCNYNGPSILINEINIFPNFGDGCIYGVPPTPPGSGEWIELFNPNWCDSIDISGYILGSYNSTGNTSNTPGAMPPYVSNGMGFVIPAGTKVPPLGFVLVRGQNADPAPTGTIDIVVNNANNQVCIQGGLTNSRIWFQNTGSWFAFYNSQGVPQDAIRYGTPNNVDLNQSPCIPPNNSLPGGTTTLATFNQMVGMGLTATLGNSSQGMTFRRIPDGGAWSTTLASENSSYGTCNDPANCAVFSGVAQCNGSGTVNITSGQAPFSFQWDDPLNQTTQTATNLCEGTYQVVVSDANNCQETYSVSVVTNLFNLSTNIQQPDCQQSNGSISINPYDPSYTYTWSPAVSTSNTAFNLSQGIYSITIEQGFCSLDTTIVLQNPVPFTTSALTVNTTCGQNNGSITITNSPTGSYVYVWSPNVSSTNIGNSLSAGTYQISISDNICVFDTLITVLPSSGLTSTASVYNSTCQQANGAIDVDVSPAGSYTFSWPSGVNSTIDSAANLVAGSYLVSFTDGICTDDTTILVTTTTPPTDITTNITATQCDENTGEIAIATTTGGTTPYTFSINNGVFSSSQIFDSLAQGPYTISVLDANNCAYQKQITVPMFAGPSLIQVNLENPYCGMNNGSLVINGTLGGTSPYSYTVNGAVTLALDSLKDLSVGVYALNVIDANGCQYIQLENLIMQSGDPYIFIPNVLTANEDLRNDLWKVTSKCVESIECVILNRWGDMIYNFNKIDSGWDGQITSGKEALPGVYFYKLIAKYFGGESEEFHGHITLIRK